MTITLPDTTHHLDFTPELPCEHSEHPRLHRPEEPAAMVVHLACVACPRQVTYLLCAPGWAFLGRRRIRCLFCGARNKRGEVLQIVRWLR